MQNASCRLAAVLLAVGFSGCGGGAGPAPDPLPPARVDNPTRLAPGTYELHLSYYDPLDYLIEWYPGAPPRVQVAYQIVLRPAAASRGGASPSL